MRCPVHEVRTTTGHCQSPRARLRVNEPPMTRPTEPEKQGANAGNGINRTWLQRKRPRSWSPLQGESSYDERYFRVAPKIPANDEGESRDGHVGCSCWSGFRWRITTRQIAWLVFFVRNARIPIGAEAVLRGDFKIFSAKLVLSRITGALFNPAKPKNTGSG